VSRTSDAGSIGVVAVHLDESEADAMDGMKYTYVFAGEHKTDYSSHKALTDSAKGRLQGEVDRLYDLFVSTVSRNRSLSEDQVRSTKALVFSGADAVQQGLADDVQSARDALHIIVHS
jgi:ClpP class serine protease